MSKYRSVLVCAVLAAMAASASIAKAEVLLVVDLTDPAHAAFSSTGGISAASDSNTSYTVLLNDFFTATGQSLTSNFSGDLAPAVNPISYGWVFSRGSTLDLNRFGGNVQTFIQGQAAFTGSSTVDMSGFTLRTGTFTGDITIRNNFGANTGIVIGQYSVIPEPAAAALLGVGGLALIRRRRPA